MPRPHPDHLSYRSLFTVIIVLLSLFVVLIRLSTKPSQKVDAAWFDDAYGYRQLLSFTHNATLSNQAVGITISTSGLVSANKMLSSCTDVRFTDPQGKALVFQYTSGCNTTTTYFSVGFPTINNGINYAYIYYGNPSALSASQATTGYTSLAPSGGNPTATTEEVGVGPVGYWKFNEGTGTTAYDSTTNNRFTTMGPGTSAPTWVADSSCIQSKCLNFDGSNDYIISSNVSKITTDLTLSAWIYPGSFSAGMNYYIIDHSSSGNGMWMQIYDGDSNGKPTLRAGFQAAGGYADANTELSTAATWYHLEVTYSSAGTINFYINGRLDKSATGLTVGSPTINTMVIGNAGNKTVPFNGRLDEIIIYNYARSAAQVLTDYNSQGSPHGSSVKLGVASTGIGGTNPVDYWNFEEGVGSSVYSTGSSQNSGSLGTGSSMPAWTSGTYGKGLQFDGNDCVSIGNTVMSNIDNFALEAWIKPNDLTTAEQIFLFNGVDNGGYGISINGGVADGRLAGIFGAIRWIDSGYVFPATKRWYHVAMVRSSGTVRFYVNGKQTSGTDAAGDPSASKGYATIGCEYSQFIAKQRFFNGTIDEPKIYNYARTQKQVVEDMNGGHPAGGSPVGSMSVWYKFNEGVGSTIYNSGAIGNTLNGNFATGTGNSAPGWITAGKSGIGLSFGGNDYATVGDEGSLRFNDATASYSLSAWVQRGAIGTTQTILSKEDADNDGWRLIFNGDNTVTCSNNITDITTTTTITDTTSWHQIICSVDRTSTGTVYIDGKAASAAVTTSSDAMATTTNLTIGARSYTIANFFVGSIDNVKIYPLPLTASDILVDYNNNQALYLGNLSTDAGGTTPDNSQARSYCVPGDTSTCSSPNAQWNFEEGVGTSAYDISGNSYNGILGTGSGSSSPTWTTGKSGKALSFDGNDFVNVSYLAANSLSAGTISIWVNFPNPASQSFFSKQNNGVNSMLIFSTDATSHFKFQVNNVAGYTTGSTVLSANTWYLLTAKWDGSTQKVFVNNIEDGSISTAQTLSNDTSTISIGAWTGDGNSYSTSIIDEVRVYSYARTSAQIAWEYNQGKPLINFKFDECQGTTINDSMGTGNTGTWSGASTGSQKGVGSCTTSDTTAWYNGRNGKYNSSLNFDGTDDYVNIGTPSILNQSQGSVSFWANMPSSGTYVIYSMSKYTPSSIDATVYITSGIANFTNSAYGYNGTKNLADSLWHHVLLTQSGSAGGFKMYIDGKPETITLTSGTDNGTWFNSFAPQANTLGATKTGASTYGSFYTGQLDNFSIYSYPLTPTQVLTLYNQGSSVRFAPVSGTP